MKVTVNMEKEQLFNCRTNEAEPDWSQFTHLTIQAMADFDGRSEIAEEGTDASFWCVLGVTKDGLYDPITDCTTLWMAGAVAQALCDLSKLPLEKVEA